jgi:hypothetical protein
VAGSLSYGNRGDGDQATLEGLKNTRSVAVDASGNIYIADTVNDRIHMVTKSTDIITTVAGNGTLHYAGDRILATSAGLLTLYGVAVDA